MCFEIFHVENDRSIIEVTGLPRLACRLIWVSRARTCNSECKTYSGNCLDNSCKMLSKIVLQDTQDTSRMYFGLISFYPWIVAHAK